MKNITKMTELIICLFSFVLAPVRDGSKVCACDYHLVWFSDPDCLKIKKAPYENPVQGVIYPYSVFSNKNGHERAQGGLSEEDLHNLEINGITANGYYTLVQSTDLGAKRVLSHMAHVPSLNAHNHVVACKIESGDFAGKYLVVFGFGLPKRADILDQSELDALERLETVKEHFLDPAGKLVDVSLLNGNGTPLFTLKLPEKVRMYKLKSEVSLFSRGINGSDILKQNPYDSIEIGGVIYSFGWNREFEMHEGDTIRICNTGNPVVEIMVSLPFGGFCGRTMRKTFSTRELLRNGPIADIPNVERVIVKVDKALFMSVHVDDVSDDLHTLPDGELVFIYAESCHRVYKIDPATGALQTFYIKERQGGDIKLYRETEGEDVLVQDEIDVWKRIIPIEDGVPTEDDAVINDRYIFCKPQDLSNIQCIGSINDRPVYLVYSKRNKAVIQTPDKLIILNAEDVDKLREGDIFTHTYRLLDGTLQTEDIRLDS